MSAGNVEYFDHTATIFMTKHLIQVLKTAPSLSLTFGYPYGFTLKTVTPYYWSVIILQTI